ncbi:hypothetical protein PENSPDRAFT_129128 [Peniophora sp. CONT]|nr:hypothetical protein PENSPDRAFT_129128 [Peniophora sp. CONT]
MFSFMKIATLAALTFGTFASAIPAPAPAAEAGALVARGKDVTSILTQLNIDLKEPCNELSILTSATATSVNVNVSVVKIKVLLQSATAACGQSSGLGSGNILGLLSICMKVRASGLTLFISSLTELNSSSCRLAATASASAPTNPVSLPCSRFLSTHSALPQMKATLIGSVAVSWLRSLRLSARSSSAYSPWSPASSPAFLAAPSSPSPRSISHRARRCCSSSE